MRVVHKPVSAQTHSETNDEALSYYAPLVGHYLIGQLEHSHHSEALRYYEKGFQRGSESGSEVAMLKSLGDDNVRDRMGARNVLEISVRHQISSAVVLQRVSEQTNQHIQALGHFIAFKGKVRCECIFHRIRPKVSRGNY